MKVQLITVFSKTSNFKVCKECSAINWLGNNICIKSDCHSITFYEDELRVINNVGKEYLFWQKEGYLKKDSDNVYYEV